MPIPEHIEPDDVDLDDQKIIEAWNDHPARDVARWISQRELDGARRVARAASTRTAFYLGMYYGQESKGMNDKSLLQRAVGDTISRNLPQWYVSEFDADGFRKRIDVHLLSNLITDMLVEKYGLDPEDAGNG